MMLKAKSRKRKAFKICNSASSGLSVFWTTDLSFRFMLSAFRFSLFAFCLLLSALSSCTFNPNLQGKGEVYLQGTWQQDSSAVQQQLVTFSQYHIRFDCDSFFMQINDFSKVNFGSDTCMRSGHWAEYVRGSYSQRHDTLLLKGQFCNADFSLKTNAECFRIGPYNEFFTVRKKADTLIQLSGTSNVIPINLHRTKKTSCILKPL
jgi:hypothetical protein